MNRVHFISGLSRSGATLPAALLRQNPGFRVGMSAPLAGLFGEMNGRSEFSVLIDDAQRRQLERVASDLSRPVPGRHAVDIRIA